MAWDPVWEEIFHNQEWGKYPGESLIRFVAKNFYSVLDRASVRMLEVGCGPGANLWFLAREGYAFDGIDGSRTAIERASQRLDYECHGWRNLGSLHVGDIGRLPFSDKMFDAVIDNEAIYCNDWDTSVATYGEIGRVLKPGGRLYSRTFAAGSWGDGTGESAGRGAWMCAEGPLAGKGASRFTSLEELPELAPGFRFDSVELLTWTLDDRRQEVREWIVQATKL